MRRIVTICLMLWLLPTYGDTPGLDLARYQGKVVYLDFWASWCKPCRQSFPWMDAMQKKYAADGLVIVAVDEDEEAEDAQKFLAARSVSFDVLPDPKGEVAERYDLIGMPSSFIIGRDGQVLKKHQGFFEDSPAAFEAEIRAALGKQ